MAPRASSGRSSTWGGEQTLIETSKDSPSRFDPILLLIVLFGALGGGAIVVWAKNWVIMPDELIYVEQARAWLSGSPALPHFGDPSIATFQQLYPLLISPLVGLLKLPDAYPWIAFLNACLMASAAVPAYLLASYVTASREIARWVALCTVVTPWLIFSSKVLPDALSYTAFICAIFAIIRTAAPSERTFIHDLIALGVLAFAMVARNQFMLLFGVWIIAVVFAQIASAMSSGDGPAGARLRAAGAAILRLPIARPLPLGLFALAALTYLFKPIWILGYYLSYSYTAGDPSLTPGLLPELLTHANSLAFGVGALPVILGLPWLVAALGRPGERRQSDPAIVILVATAVMIYVATSFDMRFDPSERVVERYIFQLAPLWFVATGAFIARPPRSLVGFAVPALLGLLLLIATNPYGLDTALNRTFNSSISPTQLLLVGWQRAADLIGSSISGLLIVGTLLGGGAIWWLVTRGRTRIAASLCFGFITAVLLTGTLLTVPDSVRLQNAAAEASFGNRSAGEKIWLENSIDNRSWSALFSPGAIVDLPSGKLKSIGPKTNRDIWRDLAFWNSGLEVAYLPYEFEPGVDTPLRTKTRAMTVDWQTGELPRAAGDDSRYLLLATGEQHFAPQSTAAPVVNGKFTLYPVGAQISAAWAVRGITPKGWIYPAGATLRVYARSGADETASTSVRLHAHAMGLRKSVVIEQAVLRVPAGGHTDLKITRGSTPMRITRVEVEPVSPLRRK